jgi:excisionase family DNA binding protein
MIPAPTPLNSVADAEAADPGGDPRLRLYTTRAIAEYWEVSRRTVQRWAQEGRIRVFYDADYRRYMIPASELEAYDKLKRPWRLARRRRRP